MMIGGQLRTILPFGCPRVTRDVHTRRQDRAGCSIQKWPFSATNNRRPFSGKYSRAKNHPIAMATVVST
jgi:hypothetical protein